MQQLPSQHLENAINQLSRLPGVGRKTALRLALYMLRQDERFSREFADAILTMKRDVKYCSVCHNISDTEVCPICADHRRDASIVCVVENVQDVLAIENTMQFNGLYHVLGGVISPMEGIGPGDIEIESLVKRVAEGEVKEIIFALASTMEGDTTSFYISRRLQQFNVAMSVIARGISVGDELEYTDELTLGRSIVNRVPFDK